MFDRPGRDAHPFWSPDGKQIAFQSTRDANKSFIVDIYKIDVDGKNPVRLTSLDGFTGVPSLSPDGKKILFQFKPMKESTDFEKNKWHILVMDADGKNQRQLTTGQSEYQVPNWSPDGSKIIFFSDKTGNNEIYKMNGDGTGIIQLTNNPADDNAAFISPDGSMIAFKSNRNGAREIYCMDIDGDNVQRLTTGHDSYGGPSWSPDCKRIAFHSAASGKNELYVIDLQSREVLQLTNCK